MYIRQKSIKWMVISYFWADLTIEDWKEETYDFLNKEVLQVEEDVWIRYLNGASNQKGFSVGIPLVSPEEARTIISVKLDFEITNNVAE